MSTGYDRILVPVDFSVNANRALREAKRLLAEGGEIILLHVTEKLEPALPWSATNRKLITKLQREARSDARAGLEKAAKALGRLRVRRRVESGVAEDRILEAARRERVGVIVIGAQGHTLSDRLLLGSTSERVARKSSVPVLIVPPPRKR